MSSVNDLLTQHDENSFSINYLSDDQRIASPDFTNKHTGAGLQVNGNNKFNALLDCDEVIVNTFDKWVKNTYNIHELKQYFTPEIKKVIDNGLVNLRREYYIGKWLGITDNTHMETFVNVYDKDTKFYDDLDVSPFFKSLKGASPMFNRVDVLTKVTSNVIGDNCLGSKLNFLLRAFEILKENNPNLDVRVHRVPMDMKKSDFINKLGLRFNMYAEDMPLNIHDVLSNCENHSYEILVPLTGYSHQFLQEGGAADLRGSKTVSMTPFFNMEHPSMTPKKLSEILALMD